MNHTKKTTLSAIVAMGKNGVIGKKNQLPWHLPADLKHFKTITTGHPIVMGRKTYESIGKPLPNRTNLIMSQNAFQAEGCITVNSIKDTLQQPTVLNSDEIFIIGGAHIYQLWMPYLERIYLTLVHHEFAGDAFFPELNPHDWQEITRESHQPDENNAYAYDFIQLEKNTAH